MKKFILFFLCVAFIAFIGCSNNTSNDISTNDVSIVIEPDDKTRENLNGYKEIDGKTSSQTDASASTIDRNSAQYIGNKNSKKFHIFDCQYAINIKEENFVGFYTSADAENNGYSPCSRCNP